MASPKSNIEANVRAAILQVGFKMCGENAKYERKMNYAELARRAGVSPKTSKLWWDRRGEFCENGVLCHRERSGRPVHRSFDSPKKVEKALDMCEDLPEGHHQFDVAEKLDCTPRCVFWTCVCVC